MEYDIVVLDYQILMEGTAQLFYYKEGGVRAYTLLFNLMSTYVTRSVVVVHCHFMK